MVLKKHTSVIITLLFVILIIFSGCLDLFKEKKTEKLFVGGTEGLAIALLEDKPPDKIYQNLPFDIQIILTNRGEADIPPGSVRVLVNNLGRLGFTNEDLNNDGIWNNNKGVECTSFGCEDVNGNNYFDGPKIKIVDTETPTQFYPVTAAPTMVPPDSQFVVGSYVTEEDKNGNGEFDSIVKRNILNLPRIFKQESGFIPGGVEFLLYDGLTYNEETYKPLTLAIEACYPYKTTAVATVCVSREQVSDICDVIGEKKVESSGAPIQVKSFNQEYSRLSDSTTNKVYFRVRLEVKNEGGNPVYSSDADCNDRSVYYKDQVKVESISVGVNTWSSSKFVEGSTSVSEVDDICGEDVITLDEDGKGYLTCNIPVSNVYADYEDRFVVVLSYTNVLLLTKELEVIPEYK